MEAETVEAVENHRFDPLKALQWRNATLDFRSLGFLLKSLEAPPPEPCLLRTRDADDHQSLLALSREPEIEGLARSSARIRLLWEVCQIPDFRKILSDAHTRLLGQIYHHLTGPTEKLPPDWVAEQIQRIDRIDGDIDMLTQRIAHIRTWTYIAHRADWLADPAHWQERTRAIEDRLSDALHQSLTSRFVDHRHAALVRRMKEGGELMSALTRSGEVVVEGHVVGKLEGFEFHADGGLKGDEARHLNTAARRALLREIPGRVKHFEAAEDGEFRLTDDARILWQDRAIARLAAGDRALKPRVEVFPSDYLDGPQRERVRRRLVAWTERLIRARLGPLVALAEADLKGSARGIAFQLSEALGLLPRRKAETEIGALTAQDRQTLSKLGIEFGHQSLCYRGIGNGKSARLAAQLWAVRHERPMPPLPAGRPLSFVPGADQPEGFCLAFGYCTVAGLAVRSDALDRFARLAHQLGRQGAFLVTEPLRSLVACDAAALPPLLRALGYRQSGQGGEVTFELKGRPPGPGRPRQSGRPATAAPADGMPPPANEDVPAPEVLPPKTAAPTKKPARRRRKQGPGPVDPHSPFAALSSLRRRLRAGR